jgi:outer membrane protein assembly factor BamB
MVGAISGGAEAMPRQPCATAVIVSATNGKAWRRLQLPVYDVVADGRGGWYTADIRLRHIRRDGSVDKTWHSPVRRRLPVGTSVESGLLTRYAARVYVAGQRRVVAVDAGTGHVLWLSPTVSGPTVGGRRPTISALATNRNAVFVAGSFTAVGGTRRAGLAALDPSDGRLLRWRAPGLFDPSVNRGRGTSVTNLALSGARLYFAGNFRRVGPKRAPRPNGVAAVRASDGRLTGFSPREQVENPALVAAWGRLVLLGCGARVSVCDADSGVFDGATGKPVHRFAFDEVLSAGAVGFRGSIAYLGTGPEGGFGGKFNLIAIDLRTGRFESRWFPTAGYHTYAASMAVSGDRVFVAGSFCPGP